jgi:hypothetical protein
VPKALAFGFRILSRLISIQIDIIQYPAFFQDTMQIRMVATGFSGHIAGGLIFFLNPAIPACSCAFLSEFKMQCNEV